MRVKLVHTVSILFIFIFLLGNAQCIVPLTEGQQANLVVDRAYWMSLANNAWKYFQPGVGIDSTTGLHGAALGYPFFTDWDLGIYIQTIIDANKLGILSTTGAWGADARINKIIAFLQTRQLSSNGLPYDRYQAANGNPYVNREQNAADAGALLVALNNLKISRPDLAGTINYIVHNRTNYAPLEQAIDFLTNSKNIYDYYVTNGFASFWPSRFSTLATSILNNIISAPTVSTYGVALPISKLTFEPLLLSVFNLAPNAKLNGLVDQVYLAHEARYKATTKFVAFSEGNSNLENFGYVYEWVVKEDGSTWVIDDVFQEKVVIVPIIYFKAAVGMLAIYNSTFAQNMVSYIDSQLPTPSSGYWDGIDENGRVYSTIADKNGMIIEAALYAIDNTPRSPSTSSPSPTPSISPSATPTQSATSTSNPTAQPTLTPSPTLNLPANSPSNNSSTAPTTQSPMPIGNQEAIQLTIVQFLIVLTGIAFIVIVISVIILKRRQPKRSQSVFCFYPIFAFSYILSHALDFGKEQFDVKV